MIKSKSDLVLSKNLRTISRLTTTPDGWKVIRIQEGFDLGRGRVINQDEIDTNPGIYPVFSSQTHNNGQMGLINSFDYDGEFLTWTTDGANAGTVFYRMGKFNCTNVCGTLKAKPGYCAKFFLYYLNTIAKYYVSYVGNPKLMNDVMGNIVLTSPPYSIQCRIADILSTTDDVIKKTEAAIEKYQAIKAGMMQDLFTRGIDTKTGKLRPTIEEAPELYKESELGWIPKEWEAGRFGDICKVKAGYSFKSSEFGSNGYRLIRISNIQEFTVKTLENDVFITPNLSTQEYELKTGDLLIALSGATTGKVGLVKRESLPALLNQRVGLFEPQDNTSIDYVYQIVSDESYQKSILDNCPSSAQPNVSPKYLEAIPIKYAKDQHEQALIVRLLKTIDSTIEIEYNQLKKSMKLKQGLMADLLTGKVRVIREDKDV